MLLFADSFSHYTQAFMAKMWDVVSTTIQSNVSITQTPTSGRFGAGGVTFAGPLDVQSILTADSPSYLQKNYSGTDVIHAALAIRQTKTQCPNGGRLLAFIDGATVQVSLEVMPSGQIRATRSAAVGGGIFLGTGGSFDPPFTVLGMSTNSIFSSAYDFLQVKVTHHPTTGSIEIRRGDDSLFWLLQNINTGISGVNNSSSLLLGGYGVKGEGAASTSVQNYHLNATISDFHLLNTIANPSDALDPVTFIGDRHWEVRLPSADGFYTEWTPSPVQAHYLNVNQVPPDDGATQNNTEPVGNRDSFLAETATGPTNASLLIAYTMYLEKNAGGAVGISGLYRSGGGVDRNGTEFQAPNPYAFRQSFLCSKPGGGPITVADFNAAQHGYERTS